MPRRSKSKAQSESINELPQEHIDDIQQPSSSVPTNKNEDSMIHENNKESNNISNIRNSFLVNKTQQLQQNNAPNNIQEDDSAYLKEIFNSQRCRDFDDYLNFSPKGDSDNCNFFVDASNNEVKYFAVKFIEFVIANPEEVKEFGAVAAKFKTILLRIRSFIAEVFRSLENEFKVMKQKTPNSLKNLDNFAKFLGELYVSQGQIIDTKFMTEFLNFLKEKKQFIILTSTLKVCGYFYKLRNRSHFKDLINSVAFGPIVEDEITKMSENFDDKTDIFTSRLFKPSENAEISGNLEAILTGIAENKDVDFDYEIYKMTNINSRRLVGVIAEILPKPNTNVVEVAQFLKTLYDLTSKIANFIHNINECLRSKIIDMSANNPQEMRTLGKLTAELKNLSVTNNETQKLWLEKIETFNLDNNFEVIEVYVDVVKAMLNNIQTQEFEKLQDIHQFLKSTQKSLESFTTAIPTRIKSKITKNLHTIILKTVTPSTSELLFKIRLGHRIDGLPKDMPENNPNILDVKDFGRIFCINAVSNYHFTANYVRSIKVLKAGPNGEIFNQSFREELSSNLFPSIFSPEFCGSDEAIGTFELILQLFKEEFLKELEIVSFLNTFLDVKNFKDYQGCVANFIDDLQLFIVLQTKKNPKKFSERLKSRVEDVQKKLKKLNVKVVKVREFNKSKLIQNAVVCQPQSAQNPRNEQNVLKTISAATKTKKQSRRSKKIATNKAKPLQNSPKNQQQNTEESQQSTLSITDPPDEAAHVFFPRTQKIQTPWSEVCHLLKNIELDPEDIEEDTLLYDQLYPEEKPPHKPQAVKDSRSSTVRLNFADLIQQSLLSKTDKKAKQPLKILPVLTPAQSTNQTDPGIQEFCKEILPVMAATTTEFKSRAITIYSWNFDDLEFKSLEKELIGLLSKELQKNHNQLLAGVSTELTDECDVLRKGQAAKQKEKQFLSSKNSFILTFRAVAPFLLKSQVYDNLDFMLNHIRDGNKIALELFLDVMEDIEYIFEKKNKERDSFVTTCIDVLEYAASFKNTDEVTLGRVTKMTQFLKSLNIQYEVLPSQMVYTNPDNNAFVSALFKKPGQMSKKSKKSRPKNQKDQSSGKSTQVAEKSSQPTKMSSEQLIQVAGNLSKPSSQVYEKSSVPLSQIIKDLNKKLVNIDEKSSGQSRSESENSSIKTSQVTGESSQLSGKSSQVPENSNVQSSQLDKNLLLEALIIIKDPPPSLPADDQVKFYLNQLEEANTFKMVSKINPFLTTNFPKLKFLDFLLQLAITDQKFINPVVKLFYIFYGIESSKKNKNITTTEVINEFISLCKNGENLNEKVINFEKFTIAFKSHLHGQFWYQLWTKLFDLFYQGYPNSLKILILSMHAKVEILHATGEFKKLMKNILDLLKQKSIVENDENFKNKMIVIINTLELPTNKTKIKKMQNINVAKPVGKKKLAPFPYRNVLSLLKVKKVENENPNFVALQKQMKC